MPPPMFYIPCATMHFPDYQHIHVNYTFPLLASTMTIPAYPASLLANFMFPASSHANNFDSLHLHPTRLQSRCVWLQRRADFWSLILPCSPAFSIPPECISAVKRRRRAEWSRRALWRRAARFPFTSDSVCVSHFAVLSPFSNWLEIRRDEETRTLLRLTGRKLRDNTKRGGQVPQITAS